MPCFAGVLKNCYTLGMEQEIPIKLKRVKPRVKQFVNKLVKENKSATQAYIEVFPTNNRDTAKANGSKLLTKTNVQQEISRQLDSVGLSTEYTDQSMQVLLDHAVNNARFVKPEAGVAIIRMINELKDRFPAKRSINANLNIDQEQFNNATLDELKQQLTEIQEQNKLLLDKL